ncbi:ABC transporter ATP-binding protein [Paenibacillus baekrokdamisoli]|uniref:Nickel import system ATP-binding protein NikD n=1 Tax=Paenibacillus baekrokdamisoli TaxID=1712516 RepID=A0A3G9IJ87_9BACL|nr:ABC transporter ATP-binding protein [Paenibacillus baekrokdamisoli]MBB3067751.1 nickel transport system ATP-binding protein [Paenibacillus baekrokdamisoli]BBH19067.1 ABC transporter ATP-binding protein [Paenibacillus baekrokdamisoli]
MKERNAILEVDRLHVEIQTYQGSVQAVRDISFRIDEGKVLGLVGESGCGKSMTCLAIFGLLSQSAVLGKSSRIRLQGRELSTMSEEELRQLRGLDMSFILQNPMNAFNPVLTIGKQFQETIQAHTDFTRKQALTLAIEALAQMNLSEPAKLLKQYPFELSGGMLQRVMIALSLSLKPALLIADEPTTALDNVNRRNVIEAFQAVKAVGTTALLLVSHDLNVIGELADMVAVMKQGEIVEMAPTNEIFSNPQHEYTKLLLDARLTASSRKE